MVSDTRKAVANKYKNQSIMTASQDELVLMLYNRCLSDINKAIAYIDQNDSAKKNEVLKNAQQIIIYLNRSLDTQFDIAKNMGNLYDYILELLIQSNSKKDIKKLKEAKALVEDFRNTWFQAMKSTSKEGVKIV
jgi:flagellar protein FliS